MVAKEVEEVVLVLFLIPLVVGLLAVCAASIWPRSGGSPGAAGRTTGRWKADPEPAATTTSSSPGSPGSLSSSPVSLEGVLVSQLTAGEITSRQYRRTMERLAAREDERHPLSVPSDGGSDEAGR